MFSQNDEDGAIEEVFRKIGTTDKVKVGSEIFQWIFLKTNLRSIKIQVERDKLLDRQVWKGVINRFMLNLVSRTGTSATHDISGKTGFYVQIVSNMPKLVQF